MKNLKLAVLWAFVVGGFGLIAHYAQADGSFQPVLSPNTTGGQYNYPTSAAPQAGGVLVNDGVGTFRWSNASVTTGLNTNASQLIALSSMTIAQINATTPTVVGQMVFCGDCTAAGGKGTICISTEAATAQVGFTLSTGTVCK